MTGGSNVRRARRERSERLGSLSALVFVAVQLSLSVYSRGDYLVTDVANVGGRQFPSDP